MFGTRFVRSVLLTGLIGLLCQALSFSESLSVGETVRRGAETCSVKPPLIRIDTESNRLKLWCGSTVVLDAACSTGSGRILRSEKATWVFDTPLGEFKIENIARDPVWRKPDWAYLEAGEELPETERDRFVKGQLGEYALGLGNGIYIHGTLYERLLGQSVTHGCIRLGSEDLAFLVENVEIGTPVEIF